MTGTADLLHPLSPDEQLDALVAGRSAVLDRIIVASRRAEVGALLLTGSLGRGSGDGWSDLDLIAVPAPGYSGLDLVNVFADKLLASLDAPRNAPLGGDYRGVCLDVAGMALWVDWYLWPQTTAVVPADATAIYDDLGLPESGRDFIPLINAHNDPAARAHPANSVTLLLRIAVAAKYLARADLSRLIAKLPEVQGLSLTEVAERLHSKLNDISDTDLADAIAATRRLVVVAAASARHHPPPDAHAIKENPDHGPIAGLAYGTVTVADHQSGWAQDAATEIARLRTVLGGHAKAIEHIGSTAVPGLAAKPIIDLAIQLERHADPASVADLLTRHGLLDRGQKFDDGGHLFVAEPTPGIRSMHVHVLASADPQWAQYLQVRDTLRFRPDLAAKYQQLKHDLAVRHADNRAAYTAAKAEFLQKLISDSAARQVP